MGTDAHGGAVFRHRERHGKLLLPAGEMHPVRVHPDAGQDVLAAGQAGGGQAARVCKDLSGRAGPQHLAAVHDDHLAAEAVGLVAVVGHEQGRAVKPGQQAAHFALHFLAEVAVQCAERLVQHQDVGLACQNAGQCSALLLPARKLAGQAAGQFLQPHGAQGLRTGRFAGGGVLLLFQRAEDVLLHRHIREQRVVLEQQAHVPLLRGQVDALLAVEQDTAIQHDAAAVGSDDARNAAQGHAFAAAGCAEDGGGGIARCELRAKGEAVEPFGDLDVQAHVCFPPCFCLRSSRLTASSTTAEMTMSTSTHCIAPLSSLVRQS